MPLQEAAKGLDGLALGHRGDDKRLGELVKRKRADGDRGEHGKNADARARSPFGGLQRCVLHVPSATAPLERNLRGRRWPDGSGR
ncbi:hypothetical protein ACFPRL_02720 [Pseudoclavibacter helvolus]